MTYSPRSERPRLHHDRTASLDDDVAELRRQVAAWVAHVEDLAARRDRRSQQPAEEKQRIRLRAMRLAWEKRGMPWDEDKALAMLREVTLRGEVRVTRWPV